MRLDVPGAETAWLARDGEGWLLAGTVVTTEGGTPAALQYEVRCGRDFATTAASVRGRIGPSPVSCSVERGASGWVLDGRPIAGLGAALDIDLAFSPATNLLPLRRLRLEPGRSARVVAAWLRYPELDLVPLQQVYSRPSEHELRYEAPSLRFSATLLLHSSGFVREYPGLWRLVCAAG